MPGGYISKTDLVSNLLLYIPLGLLAATIVAQLGSVDVAIQENEMRELCREFAPDRLELFEMVYAARFRRLWETWRSGAEDTCA